MSSQTISVSDLKGKVDFGLITILEDEFKAVLQRLPPECHAIGNRRYALHRLRLGDSDYYQIAVVRAVEPGGGEAQDVARDLIIDLDPKWLVLVGIAGGVPEYEFTLGDVVAATRLSDFSVRAAIEGCEPEYATGGGPMHKRVQVLLAHLPAINEQLQGWNEEENIGMPKPPVKLRKENFYGSEKWQRKVKERLERHFGRSAKPRPPLVTAAPIASSDDLVKDTETIQKWLDIARHIKAVEMELAGVYRAAWRKERVYPILAIRGISDIVGFERHPDWTTYACHSAASFAHAFLKARPIEPVDKRSPFRKAYLVEPHGHMLQRERLSKEDLEEDHAVKPQQVEQIVKALEEGRSVAVQGPPGSGKSALAAWTNWLAEKNGKLFAAFFGHEEQNEEVNEVCRRLEEASPDHILIIDDIHLIEPVLVRVNFLPQFAEGRFLLLGRAPYVERAMRGKIPKIHEPLINVTNQDSSAIAEALSRKYCDGDTATRLLNRTGKDLVLTKWLLEAVYLDHLSPDSTPEGAALEKLKEFRDESYELLRLFLTLAAFGWMELWCPERLLTDDLKFNVETLKRLIERLYEAERETHPEANEGYAFRLRRHPKLCELFLDTAPKLLGFDQHVFAPTCKALKIESDMVKPRDFALFILGVMLAQKAADLLSIEWRLVYGGRCSDYYVNLIKLAAKLRLALYEGISGPDLPLDEKIHRLNLAFAAANGERRLHGGLAARRLLEEMQQKLGVSEIPEDPFPEKGYMLYQDAYIMRLNNAGQQALDRFEESAAADEEWATANNAPEHNGKAAMSRIAAAIYSVDLAVFEGSSPPDLHPNRARIEAARNILWNARRTIEELLASGINGEERRRLEGYHKNAVLHLAETAGWLGDTTEIDECLAEFELDAELDDSIRLSIGLARGAHALVKEQYGQVIEKLKGQPEERVKKFKGGEVAGKTGVMLLISYLQVGAQDDAEAMRSWLVSGQCRVDAGNGLAKTWAADLAPIRGAK